MSVFSRRNAVTGWAVWKVVQRLVRKKIARFRPPPPPPKRRPVKSLVAFVTAAGLGAAGFLRLRRRGSSQ